VEQAVDRMQYYQHSRQTQSSKPERDVRQVGPADAPQPKEWRELKKQMNELAKELKDRDELIKQMSELMKELRDQAELTKQIRERVGELKGRASLPWRSETPHKVRFKDAENQDEGLVAQMGPGDSRVGEEVYQIEEPPGLYIVR
jgi:hypothetical protein